MLCFRENEGVEGALKRKKKGDNGYRSNSNSVRISWRFTTIDSSMAGSAYFAAAASSSVVHINGNNNGALAKE